MTDATYRDAMAAGRVMARRYQHALGALAAGQDALLAYVPLDSFLVWLAQGWRFAGLVVEPMRSMPHGYYSCLLEKEPGDE